jgi:hypothetical protein
MTYYEALQLNVSASGYYQFSTNSTMDTYGYLYRNIFDPFEPSRNQIAKNDDGCEDPQFRIDYFLQRNETYTLVVTTYWPQAFSAFIIVALSEADPVNFTRLGETHRP